MYQPKRIKHKRAKATKRFTWKDVIEFFTVLSLSWAIAFLCFYPLDEKIKWIILGVTFQILLIFILPFKSENCKVYELLIRLIKFKSMPSKYNRKTDEKDARSSADLNPYSTLINPYIVKNKVYTNDFLKRFKKQDVGNNYFSVFELQGKNIWIEDEGTQISLIDNFARILDSFKFKFSFIKLDKNLSYTKNKEYIDKSKYNMLISEINTDTKEFWKRYYSKNYEDFEKLEKNDVSNVFYIVVNAPTIGDLEEVIMTLIQKCDDYGLLNIQKLKNFELLKFLNDLNRFGLDDNEIELYLNQSDIYESDYSLDRLFRYNEVVFKPRNILIDGKLYDIKCVGKMPVKLSSEWLKTLFSVNGTVVWNNFPYKDINDINKIIDKASRKNEDQGNLEKSIINKVASSIEETAIITMIHQIQNENYNLFDSNVFVFDSVENKDEIKQKNIKLKNIWQKANFGINDLTYRQFEGFLDVLNYPTTKLDREYYQITSVNQAYGYPFTNQNLNDGKNMLVGKDIYQNNGAISWDMFALKDNRTNHNVMILGTPGMGKSTFTKKILTSIVSAGNIAIVIDPQAEYIKWAKQLNGQIIDLGSGTNTVINPLQVKAFIARDEDNLENIDIQMFVNNHLIWLGKFFGIVFDNLTSDKWSILEHQIIHLYKEWGIYKLKDLKDLAIDKWPTMSDLIKSMRKYKIPKEHHNRQKRQEEILDFAEMLSYKFEDYGSLKTLFNGHTNININNKVVVFKNDNLTDTDGSLNAKLSIMVLLSLINEFIFNNAMNNKKIIKEYKEKHNLKLLKVQEMQKLITYSALCIDEEHIYLKEKNSTTLEYIADTTKLVRKLDCGTIHTTQNPGDYKQSEAVATSASRIIDNCQYSFFFGLKDSDLETVQSFYKNSNQLLQSEIRFIASKQKGKVLATINNNQRYKINLHFNDVEKELFFDKGE